MISQRNPEIQRQPRRDLPVIHEVHSVLRLPEPLRIALTMLWLDCVPRRAGNWRKRCRCWSTGRAESVCLALKVKVAGIGQGAVIVEVALVLVAEMESCGSREAR